MNNPLVSIICICKNSKEYIRQCIESVLRQDYKNFEFLIQDGASTDGTVEIIREYRDKRIKLVSAADSGGGEAMVNVIKRINGDIWGSCLSDEELLPYAISWAVLNFSQYPEAAAIYGDSHIIDETGKIILSARSSPWNFAQYLCCEIVPPFSASFFRTDAFKKIGYDRYNDCGEFDLWLRLGRMFQIKYIPCFVAYFRRHATAGTTTTSVFYKTLPGRIQAIEKITSDPDIPEHIRSLKFQALAGLHLWIAENFLTHGHISEAGDMIVAALAYAPRQDRLMRVCRSFGTAANKIDAHIDMHKPVMDALVKYFNMPEQPHFVKADGPYLSIVVTARNDNHGGDMMNRIQTFVDSLVCQCRKFNLAAELIVVEWNPPKDKKRIYDEISWPSILAPLSVRFIEVPSEIHDSLENADKFPLFQMIAKNVGIRRANGQYVLATNIDIIFSDELMWFLSQKMLDEKYFYRIDRYDIGKRTIPAGIMPDNLIKYCESNIIRINAISGTIETSSHAGILFDKPFTSLSKQELTTILSYECNHLHENGCGDFTLMSKEYWHQLKAYPELHKWSIYIDGLIVHMAYAAGLKQVILPDPMRIYHIEHDLGWAVTQETTKTRPSLDYNKDYRPWCDQMIKEMKPRTTNDDKWGFADHVFPEKCIEGNHQSAMHDIFSSWISTIAVEQNRLYYRDQTPESLQMLIDLVHKHHPSRIVELGTLNGISLRTWLAADNNLKVTAIDLSFKPLRESEKLIPLNLERVQLVETDILKLQNFRNLFDLSERTLFYIDAHDLPGMPIMEHLISTAFPQLPDGSIIAIDDIWYSTETLTNREMAESFFDRCVADQIDSLQYCEFYYAPYWEGGSFMGFPEIIPFLNWINKFCIKLEFIPGVKSASLIYDSQKPMNMAPFTANFFGQIQRTPFSFRDTVSTSFLDKQLKAITLVNNAIKMFTISYPLEHILRNFVEAHALYPDLSGIRYAIAVCLAQLGKHDDALVMLHDEIQSQGHDSVKAASLLEAIESFRDRSFLKNNVSNTKLTIFAIPKAFKGQNAIIQRNAITSWTKLLPRPNIILLGKDEGTYEIAKEYGLIHIPEVACNEVGTPLVNSIFELSEKHSNTPWLAYLNADCLLLDDFSKAMEVLDRELTNHQINTFFLSSQRIELDLKEQINFESDTWQTDVRYLVKINGVPDYKAAIEMFFYSRGLYKDVPPFAIGRTAWDNWLVWAAEANGATMIDATTAFSIVHQCHDWSHINGGWKQAWQGEEAKRNVALAQGHNKYLNHVTTHTLYPIGLERSSVPDETHNNPLVNRRVNRGVSELTAGNYGAALDYFSDAIMRGGVIVENIHYYRALCYAKLGKNQEAIEAVQKELSIRANNSEAQDLYNKIINTLLIDKRKLKVLLISLPGLNTGNEPIYPLGIGYLLAAIRQDRTAQAVHYQLFDHATQQLPEIISAYQPEIVGLTCTTFNRGNVRQICAWLRKHHPHIKIILGGVHVSFFPDQALHDYGADCVVIGEGEITFRELCNALDKDISLVDVKGIAFRNGEQIVTTAPREVVHNLDDLPMPDYSYAGDLMKRSSMGFVITSRGCPVRCHFCSTGSYWGQRVRINSPRRVVDEMEALISNYGVKKIFFHDDTFNLGTKRVEEICNEISARRLNVEWGVSCRVHPVSQEMIDMMVAAGCRHICWGIESGSVQMLARINKKITQEQISRAYEMCRKHLGTITVGAFTLVGNPGESEETIAESARFINTLSLTDPPSTAILCILPGTQLYKEVKEKHEEIDKFWAENDGVPLYNLEHSVERLQQWSNVISRSGNLVRFDRNRHFWNDVLFGNIPPPSVPVLSFLDSELNHVIPPEIKEDEFYYLIQELARTEQLSTVLEIGSSAGGGSTEAFVKGLSENQHGTPQLFCMEVSKPRYSVLARSYADKSFVHCYNTSSAPIKGFPSSKDVEVFYHATKTSLNNYPLERVLGWLAQDIDYVRCTGVDEDGIERIKRENGIDCFDMVLLDGSEFTGKYELDKVYGARIILLDDINGFKNYHNYQRLVADPDYDLMAENWKIRNGYAVFKKKDVSLPIHFFTIVLNGEPFIRHHIEAFKQLPFKWHWHIVEGVADLKHDTGWSLQFGGRITGELHRNGLSNDGTTEYLNQLIKQFPENITIYRKPNAAFWNGKLEMVNAPLANIQEECLLWQVDSDELWTTDQIQRAHILFANHPDKTAAFYLCNFFVGPELIITTRNTYGNHTNYEWLRTWRYKPEDRWVTHEPPCLCRKGSSGKWIDLAKTNPLMHLETSANSLVFNHYAYVTKQQLRFKEIYYGYTNAVRSWNSLQAVKEFPVLLKDYFPWVKDMALVDKRGSNTHTFANIKHILWIRTDSIGDNILASSMLPHIKEKYPDARITVVCQTHIAELYSEMPFIDDVIHFNRYQLASDDNYRDALIAQIKSVCADLILNSVYSREVLTDVLALSIGGKETVAFAGDISNITKELLDKHNHIYTIIIQNNSEHKTELERFGDFLKGIGIEFSELKPSIWITSEDQSYAEHFFNDNRLIPEKTIALFACAQSELRSYSKFGISLREICKELGLTVLALGGAKDFVVNQQNLNDTGAHTINLSGKTTLRQSAALIKRCQLAVGVDTSLAHIACAVGVPNVITLGGGHFGRFMPYSSLTSIVCLPLECYNCNWQCKYIQAHCIKDINPKVLAEAVRQTIKGTSEKPRMFVQGTSLWKHNPEQPIWQSFHNFLNIADVEIVPVGDIPYTTAGIWEKLRLLDRTAQILFLEEAADEFIQHGEKLFSYNDFEGAELSFRRALELQHNNAKALNNLGVLYYKTGNNEKALQHYETAVKSQPDNATFVKNLADFYYVVQKDTEKALQMYIKGLSINPSDIEILTTLGNISIENKEFESAKDFYKRVLQIDPQNKDALKIIDLLNNYNQVMIPEQVDARTIQEAKPSEGYIVSAIVSAYNSERFIRGCIEDLEAQTISYRLEIVIVDSCSPQNERAIVEEMQRKYNNIKYIRTDKRETVYAAWNRGIKAASGKYITNANTDDRHRHDAFQVMVNELERRPEIALVYADVIMTEKENETFACHTPCGNFKWLDWDRNALLGQGCFMGPQPMWRRSVHDEYGYFDDAMVTSGDYEFWLRISQTHNFYHIHTPLGLYLKSPESIEHGNREKQRQENTKILSLYRDAAQRGRIVKYGTLDKSMPSYKEENTVDIAKKSFVSGLTSIVMHSFSNLKHLRQCIQELEKYTPEQHEILFVDYNIPADIKKWLKKQIETVKHYKYVAANRDQCFVDVLNKGISESSGEFIVLLSSDVIVSENWLSDMLECLQGAGNPAIVGPMANNVIGHQDVHDANLKSLDQIKKFRERNRHRRILTRNLEGFCMLFRRKLVIDIGLLDETFIADKYVFNDFCFRATLAGHINIIAGDVFLHNNGSSMSGNIQIFDEKWTGIDVQTPLGKKVAAFNFIEKADTLHQKGQMDKAITMFIEAIKYAPEEKAAYYRLAEMLLDAKLYKDALEAIQSMPQGSKDELKRLEIIAYCAQDTEEAEKLADRILAVDKNYAPAFNLKGMNAYKHSDNNEADDFFKKAIASDPGYGEPYTNLGVMKWAAEKQEEALEWLEKGFILSPTITDNVTLYHTAVTTLEVFQRAEKLFQDAKKLNPENKMILFFLIDIFIKQGKFDNAMHEIEQAMLDIGIEDGMLEAALSIREKVGIKEIDKAAKNKGSLSLCMIVKNEEQHLTRCLLSATPVVDEMILVDTGSTDRTKDIARAFGAKVFDFPWTNDFSEARNISLSKATGDWILVLDADEVISALDYPAIEKIVKKKTSKPAAYSMNTRNYTNEVNSKGWIANDRKYLKEEAGTGWFPSAKVRLFANDKRIQFQNPVHEFVEATLEAAGVEIKTSDIPVHHYGRFDKDKILVKGREYFLLGKKKIEAMKDDLKALKELAIQASELEEYDTAIGLWKRVIELNPNDPVALLNISYAYMKQENYEDARASSHRAMELDPAMKETALNYAGSEFIVGDITKTISILEKLLRKEPDYPPAMALIGAAYYVAGQKEKSLDIFEKLRKKRFDCTEFFDEQIRALMSQGRFDQAFSLLEAAVKTGSVNKDTKTLLAECHGKMGGKTEG